jgi:hypothetical protein
MKHWDLIPGERVELHSIAAVPRHCIFAFRTTRFALFETSRRKLIEFELLDSGSLVDVYGLPWYIAGPDRHTRTLIESELGAGKHFTRKPDSLKRAAAGG